MEYYIDPVVFIVGKTGGENRAVRNLLDLFAEGATIPFIARYRKEKTGNMDEVRIGEIKTLYTQFQELEKRKNAVLDTIRDTEEALQGARDIIAEWVNESEAARNRVRCLVEREAVITAKVVKGKEQEGEKYTDYFNFQESLKRCPSHRILAIRRGEAEGILKVSLSIDEENALENYKRRQ